MEDKIKILENQIKDFQKQIDELKSSPKFEVGKWYKSADGMHFVMLLEYERQYSKVVGIIDGYWKESKTFGMHGFSEMRPATKEDIESALIKEAEKRGFKEGAYFKCLEKGIVRPYKQFYKKHWGTGTSLKLKYFIEDDHLFCDDGLWNEGENYCSNPSIYRQGKWAEIVPSQPKLTFGGHEVTIEKEGMVTYIICKGEKGTYGQLKAIYDDLVKPATLKFGSKRLERFRIKGEVGEWVFPDGDRGAETAKIGCTWGTMEEIKNILDACEKL